MESRKKDKRSEKTREIIKKSLLKLLGEKNLKEITIKELTAEAKINRVTFYDYFDDIYQLYEEVENDIFSHFTKALDDEKIVSYEDFYSFIVDYLLEDKNMGKMILQSLSQNGRLFIKLRDFFVQGCFDTWQHEGRTKGINQELALAAHYRVSGVMGLLLQ